MEHLPTPVGLFFTFLMLTKHQQQQHYIRGFNPPNMPSVHVNLTMRALVVIEEIRKVTGWSNFKSKWISAAIMEKACRDFPHLMGVDEE